MLLLWSRAPTQVNLRCRELSAFSHVSVLWAVVAMDSATIQNSQAISSPNITTSATCWQCNEALTPCSQHRTEQFGSLNAKHVATTNGLVWLKSLWGVPKNPGDSLCDATCRHSGVTFAANKPGLGARTWFFSTWLQLATLTRPEHLKNIGRLFSSLIFDARQV